MPDRCQPDATGGYVWTTTNNFVWDWVAIGDLVLASAMLFCVFFVLFCQITPAHGIDRPYIGVLTQPCACDTFLPKQPPTCSLMVGAAAKWIEYSGANVIPIRWDLPLDELGVLFSKINGLFYAGGNCPGHMLDSEQGYFLTATTLIEWVLDANDLGDFFPFWGTCQGFQHLMMIISGRNTSVLFKGYNAWDVSYPLIFYPEMLEKSRIFQSIPEEIRANFQTENITYNIHNWGITPETFAASESLRSLLTPVSWNYDTTGQNRFVSTVEGKKYPLYGTQWHSEAPLFLDGKGHGKVGGINHSYVSVQSNQAMSMFFVNEARKSTHKFPGGVDEANKYVIENHCAEFVGSHGEYWDEMIYFFGEHHL